MRIVAFAGGVGGAKLADGLYRVLPPGSLTVVVNTGDDFSHLGLRISPDVDTVCYTLAGLANPITGWGLAGESWNALDAAARLGAPDWFHIGDRDLGTHLERTRRLAAGQTLSAVTRDFCRAWGVQADVLPMTDQLVATMVHTGAGDLAFQEYFVHQQCQPEVTGFDFAGMDTALPAPGVLDALERADAVIICPSNPWVSIAPILGLPGIANCLHKRVTVAVSPIIAGKAVKGPAAKMFVELGIEPSARSVANQYRDFLDGFVLDNLDRDQAEEISHWGIISLTTDSLMRTVEDRVRLAQETLAFTGALSKRADLP